MLGKLHLADMDLHGKFEGLVPAMDFALIQGGRTQRRIAGISLTAGWDSGSGSAPW
jgi:hypothetical protein